MAGIEDEPKKEIDAPKEKENENPLDLDLLIAWGEAETATREASQAKEDDIPVRKPDGRIHEAFRRLGYPDTDEGAAARFLAWQGESVAWCNDHPQGGKAGGLWLVWHPNRGWLVDNLGVIRRLAILCARYCASPEAQGIDHKWASKMGNVSSINAMLSLVKTVRSVSHALLDSDPYSLAVRNGVIDLRTGTIHGFCKRQLITRRCNVDFDPEQKAHSVLKCFEGNYEASDLVMLQEFLGSCLNGAVRDRLMCYWTGPSGNGKTTCTKAVSRMMGDYSTQVSVDLYSTSIQGRETETELARLAGRRFVFAPECDSHKTLSEARVKHLTGADDIRYRVLYGEAGVAKAGAKHLIYGNEKPRINGRDSAFWRRILLIEATGGIEEGKENPDLQDTATECPFELSGILNWMLEGHARWMKNGMRICLSARAKEAREKYRKEEDTTGAFLEEETNRGESDKKIKTSDLYKHYRNWANDQGMRFVQSQKEFSASIFKDFERRKIRGYDYWIGVEMKNEKTIDAGRP